MIKSPQQFAFSGFMWYRFQKKKSGDIVIDRKNEIEIDNDYLIQLKDDCFYYANQYIDTLPDKEIIYKSMVFNGMLHYIYINVFDNETFKKYKYNIDMLDYIYNYIFSVLCTSYNMKRTILLFSTFLNIDKDSITNWKNGKVKKLSNKDISKVKSWYRDSETDLLSGAINDGSIGSIFALKSVFNYRENDAIQPVVINNNIPALPTENIAKKYGIASKKPQYIETEDD